MSEQVSNPNQISWPRRITAGLVVTLGAVSCGFNNPGPLAEGKDPIVPVACGGIGSNELSAEMLEVADTIDRMLCVKANNFVQDALENYRADGIHFLHRSEGQDKDNYQFTYSNVLGHRVAVDFERNPDGTPDLGRLRQIHYSKFEGGDGENAPDYESTFITYQEDTDTWRLATFKLVGDQEESFSYHPQSLVLNTTDDDSQTPREIENRIEIELLGLVA